MILLCRSPCKHISANGAGKTGECDALIFFMIAYTGGYLQLFGSCICNVAGNCLKCGQRCGKCRNRSGAANAGTEAVIADCVLQ